MSVQTDYSPNQPRQPKGVPRGGEFAPIAPGAPVSAEQGNAYPPNKDIQEWLGFNAKFQRSQSPDWKGKLPAEFQLEHGRGFIPDANTFKGRRGTQHQCYSNAGKAALNNPDLTYVEGHVTVHGIPINHAWNTDSKGRLIDPTLKSDPTSRVGGYWGVPVKTSYLRDTIMRKETWGVLQYDNAEKYLSDPPEKIVKKRLDAFDEVELEIVDAVNEFFDDWRDQPRKPKGTQGGGRWTKGSGFTTPAVKRKDEPPDDKNKDEPPPEKSDIEKKRERERAELNKRSAEYERKLREERRNKPAEEPKREKIKKEGKEIGEVSGSGREWKAHPVRGEERSHSSRELAILYLIHQASRLLHRAARHRATGRRDAVYDYNREHYPAGTPGGKGGEFAPSAEEQKKLPFDPALHEQQDPNQQLEPEQDRKKKLKDKLQQSFGLEGPAANVEDKIVDLWDEHIKMEPEEFVKGMLGDKLTLNDSLELSLRNNGKLDIDGYFKGGGYLSYTFDFDQKEVHLDLINVPKTQPKGSTKSMMGANLEMYEKLGMEKVSLYANIRDGGYAWARYGFTPTDPSDIYGRVQRRANDLSQNGLITSDDYRQIKSLASGNNPKTIWDIAEHRLGPEMLLSNSWDGEMNLKDAGQVQRFKRYVGR